MHAIRHSRWCHNILVIGSLIQGSAGVLHVSHRGLLQLVHCHLLIKNYKLRNQTLKSLLLIGAHLFSEKNAHSIFDRLIETLLFLVHQLLFFSHLCYDLCYHIPVSFNARIYLFSILFLLELLDEFRSDVSLRSLTRLHISLRENFNYFAADLEPIQLTINF
jgi:hypothetical protein